MENNRSVEMMERINKAVGRENRAALLHEYYPIGQSHEGADAYPPLITLPSHDSEADYLERP